MIADNEEDVGWESSFVVVVFLGILRDEEEDDDDSNFLAEFWEGEETDILEEKVELLPFS